MPRSVPRGAAEGYGVRPECTAPDIRASGMGSSPPRMKLPSPAGPLSR